MKHKHAELIKAWADGAIIEARYEKATGWTDWQEEDAGFIWYIGGAEYRIKPEPEQEQEPQYLYVYNYINTNKTWMSPTLMRETSDWIYLGKVRVEK